MYTVVNHIELNRVKSAMSGGEGIPLQTECGKAYQFAPIKDISMVSKTENNLPTFVGYAYYLVSGKIMTEREAILDLSHPEEGVSLRFTETESYG